MEIYDIIRRKRDGKSLTREEINYFVKNYVDNKIPDYQIAALLMAIFINKMDKKETLDLTKAMIDSGDRVDLSNIEGVKVDKHSTGGVGDTTTIALGPMIAACNVPFVKMSGRGLGHTGGTLDKLESIKDFRVELDIDEFIENANEIKISLCSQTANITPADKKFYALRDVTATVENLSLIASSIMSKKLATGSDAIILDIKLGSGAFMKSFEDAIVLGEEMVAIGTDYGRETIALITNMDEPLGKAVGNSLEIKEAIELLQGKGPDDLYNLCIELGSYLLVLAKRVANVDEARTLLYKKIQSGAAYEKLLELVKYQKGDIDYIKNPDLFPKAKHILEVKSDQEGYVKALDAEEVGRVALHLGAGRETLDSTIDYSAGIILNKKIDDRVDLGETLAYIHCNQLEKGLKEIQTIKDIYLIGEKNPKGKKLIYGLVTKDGVDLF